MLVLAGPPPHFSQILYCKNVKQIASQNHGFADDPRPPSDNIHEYVNFAVLRCCSISSTYPVSLLGGWYKMHQQAERKSKSVSYIVECGSTYQDIQDRYSPEGVDELRASHVQLTPVIAVKRCM